MSRCAPNPFYFFFFCKKIFGSLSRAASGQYRSLFLSTHSHPPSSSGLLGPFHSGCAQRLQWVLAMRRAMVSHRPHSERSAKPGLPHRLTSRSSGRAKNMSWSRKEKQQGWEPPEEGMKIRALIWLQLLRQFPARSCPQFTPPSCCLMTNCVMCIYSSPSVFLILTDSPPPPDIPSHLPAALSRLRYLHQAPVAFSNWPL